MTFVRTLVIALALFEAAWMAYDGTRALIRGDYVTPSSGPHAGRLGPWQHVVRAVGIPPRSLGMKLTFAGYGVAWLLVIGAFVRGAPWASTAMIVAAAGSLWYLPIGTVCGAIQIICLLWSRGTA
jgi:hypothetical protein